MPKVISALTARTQFGQIMKRAAKNDERFLVDKRGEPTVMIMGVRDYIRAVAPPPGWLKAIRTRAKRLGTNRLSMGEIDAEIRTVHRKMRKKKK